MHVTYVSPVQITLLTCSQGSKEMNPHHSQPSRKSLTFSSYTLQQNGWISLLPHHVSRFWISVVGFWLIQVSKGLLNSILDITHIQTLWENCRTLNPREVGTFYIYNYFDNKKKPGSMTEVTSFDVMLSICCFLQGKDCDSTFLHMY